MSSAEKEHFLALKVMRLTKPTLGRANLVNLDGRDVDGLEDPYSITNTNDANIINNTPYECNSPAMLLPQNFGNIFLGENFSCYVSIHNPSSAACRNVITKIELQTTNNRVTLPTSRSNTTITEVPPGHSLDDIIQHEVKEMGTHILVCTVNYVTPSNNRQELRKFFKFQVLKPLELKTKFLNAENGDVYLEAQIQNITPGGIYLERVALEPASNFISEDLSHNDEGDPFERYVNSLDMYQFLYRITPVPELRDNPKLLKKTTAMGRLDIHWRSSMGEKGRLQTSPLQRLVPGYGDVKLTVKSMQSQVRLEQAVTLQFQLTNASERKMDLRLELQNGPSCGILWTGISGRQLGTLEPNQHILLSYQFIPIKPGLQTAERLNYLTDDELQDVLQLVPVIGARAVLRLKFQALRAANLKVDPKRIQEASDRYSAPKRKPRQRNYAFEKSKQSCTASKTKSHPLGELVSKTASRQLSSKQPSKSNISAAKIKDPLGGLEGSDPLSMLTASSDPLSILAIGNTESNQNQMSRQVSTKDRSNSDSVSEGGSDVLQRWSHVKDDILSKYTTSEKLSITSSFLTGGDSVRTVRQSGASVSDKVKNRLEQLDDFEDGSVKEMLNLSQQDYVKRIGDLNNELQSAWNQDQRVKALKIAIQCAKMLAKIDVIQFYPSKFVLITEILDTFGKLVYDRIMEKSTYKPKGSSVAIQLPENFTPDQVPESAKETCRNWFFKIASIRELIPRFYVEAAILKCYRFFKPSEMTDALTRLASMCRGVGNPLVASYARSYLAKVGLVINATRLDHVWQSFDDLLLTHNQVMVYKDIATKQNVSLMTYLSLYSPPVDWILECLAENSEEKQLLTVLKQVQQHANSGLLLNGILRSYAPQYIANRCLMFVELIGQCEETAFPKHVLYSSLGEKLSLADPAESDKLKILNEVWKFITKLKEPADYIQCAETWMGFVMKHFGKREMNTVLTDIIKHMTPDRAFEDFYPNLLSIMAKVLDHVHNYTLLFSLEKFLSFVDLFQKDNVKISAAKIIVEAFCRYQIESVSDPVITSTIMYMCKTLHDSVNAMSLIDERRAVSQLICLFIHKVDYGNNFEQQLNFYVDSRANFTNLDPVITELIQCVNNLSITTRKIVKGNHGQKTSAFVRACAAYCFITIPSLDSTFIQLNLYLLSGQVALLNRCLSQAEALFKAGISALLEAPTTITVDGKPKSSETFLIQYIHSFLSNLIIVPDNPDQGVLVLFKGLINVIKSLKFDGGEVLRIKLYLSTLAALSAVSQQKYLYHVDRVESNDTLYGHDGKFVTEIEKIGATIIDGEILSYLRTLSEGYENLKTQSHVALLTLENLIVYGDITDDNVLQLCKNLWSLSQKYGYQDAKLTTTLVSMVKKKASQSEHAAKLLHKMGAA